MQFKLSKEEYMFLKDNSEPEISDAIKEVEEKDNDILFIVNEDDLLTFIHDAVFLYGMDDEYAPTKIGKRLYSIYDEILYQMNNLHPEYGFSGCKEALSQNF